MKNKYSNSKTQTKVINLGGKFIMKRITSIIMVTLLVVSLFAFVGCSPSEEIKEGAYFSMSKNKSEYAVVYEDNLTLFTPGGYRFDVFELSREKDYYFGETVRATVEARFIKDKLTIDYTYGTIQERIHLKLDSNIQKVDTEPIQLQSPSGFEFSPYGISWRFVPLGLDSMPQHHGILGVKVEVKAPGEDTFVLKSIEDFIPPPAWLFEVNLKYLDLPQGTSTIKISYVGGAFIGLYSQGEPLSLSLDSEKVFFEVTRNGSDYTIREI